MCAAILNAPISRPERRRALREIRKGRDIIALGNNWGDAAAFEKVLLQLSEAPPPA
jgi:hypothetical protein